MDILRTMRAAAIAVTATVLLISLSLTSGSAAADSGAYVLDRTIQGAELDLPPHIWSTIGGLDMGPDGTLYVSDAADGRISRIPPSGPGSLLVRIGGGLVSPGHVALDPARQRLYAADMGLAALVAIDLATGVVEWSALGIAGPAGVAVAPDGRILIAASDTGQVHVFSPDGEELDSWSAAPVDEIGLGDLIRGIDVDADGMVYVVDGRLDRISIFDLVGARRQTIKPPANAFDVAVEFDPTLSARKRIWAAVDIGFARYETRTREWETARTIVPPVALTTRIGHGMAAAFTGAAPRIPGGMRAPTFGRVEQWNYPRFGGLPDATWGGTATRMGSLVGPHALSVGADGRLIVIDAEPRVQTFAPTGEVLTALPVAGAIDTAAAAEGVLIVLADGTLTARGPTGSSLWSRPAPPSAVALGLIRASATVAVLTSDGNVHLYDAGDGSDLPGLRLPDPPGVDPVIGALWRDLAVDDAGALYALCARSDTVTRIGVARDVTTFAVGGDPTRLTVTGDGFVLVLGRDGWVRRYDAAGSPGGALDAVRFDFTTDSVPADLAAAGDGSLFVADRRADLISRYVWNPSAPPTVAPDETAACRHYPDKRAAPSEIWLGETVDVRLTVRGGCGRQELNEPLDVILIVDESGSMQGERNATARAAARNFVAEIDLELSRIGLVGFDTTARLHHRLSDNVADINAAIDMLQARGGTRIDRGLNVALREMRRGGRAGVAKPIFVLLSDGYNNAGHEPVLVEADAAKAEGIEIYTIGIMADVALMTAVASSPEHYFASASARSLFAIFDIIAERMATATLFRHLVVTDVIPDNMAYIAGSAVPPAAHDPATNTLVWTLTDVDFRGFVLSYRLEPLEVGLWPTNVVAWGEGRDGYDVPTRVDFPVPEVRVRTLTVTPSPSPSPTPTPTVTPSSTPTPGPIYLPVLLRERCTPERVRADIVLVLDTSSSMTGQPLEAAKAAAVRFVDIVLAGSETAIGGAGSRIAIVGFNREAWRAHDLSDDAAALVDAIMGLEVTPGTRIDFGLAAALAELRGPRATPGNTPTVVLLTDGLHNGPPDPVYALAVEARDAGMSIFMIGLGADVDVPFLETVAGSARRTYLAPGNADLRAIYEAVAGDIPCPADVFWGRR